MIEILERGLGRGIPKEKMDHALSQLLNDFNKDLEERGVAKEEVEMEVRELLKEVQQELLVEESSKEPPKKKKKPGKVKFCTPPLL